MAGLTDYFKKRYDSITPKIARPIEGAMPEESDNPKERTDAYTPPAYQPPITPNVGTIGAQIGQMGDILSGGQSGNFTGYTGGAKTRDELYGGTNGDTIYDKQMTLAERLAAEQRRLAEEAASYKRQSLADQLDAQRRQYAQQLASMNEQMYGQGNRLLEGLANRGLATSGLLQLGDVQSQMAKGQGLSELAYQDRLAREGIGEAEGRVRSDLFSALRQAELDKAGTELGAEESLYQRQQQETAQAQALADRQISMGVSLIENAVANGTMSAQEAQDWYIALSNARTPEEAKAILEATDFKDKTNLNTLTENIILGEQGFQGGAGYADEPVIRSSGGEIDMDISQYITRTSTKKTVIVDGEEMTLNVPSINYDFNTINNELKNKYTGFKNFDKITVNYIKNEGGQKNSKPFGFKNPLTGKMEWYKTWNEASNAYDNLLNQEG